MNPTTKIKNPPSEKATHSKNISTPAQRAFWRRKNHSNITGQTGRILQALGYPGRRQRDLIDAIQAAHGAGADAETPYTPFARSHLSIANYMDLQGKPDSRVSVVSRALTAHKKWQRKTGYTLIDVISPTEDNDVETTTYIDHLTPIADESFQRALSSDLWKKDKERALAESVAWAIGQLPKDKPEKEEKPESSPMPLADYIYMQELRLLQSINTVRERISHDYRADEEAERFVRKLASKLAKTADTERKTRKARGAGAENHSGEESALCDSISMHAVSEVAKADSAAGGHAKQSTPSPFNPPRFNGLIFQNRANPPSEAIQAVEAFRGVDCQDFEWFYLQDDPKKEGAYHRMTGEELATEIDEIVLGAEQGGESFIVRPRGSVLQIDDCAIDLAEMLAPFAFLTIETSLENFQVWLAFHDDWDKAEARGRLFAQLKQGWTGNPGAGGATRWPGSINQKPNRNGWRVRIDSVNPGRIVTPSELDDAGWLADPPSATEWNWQPNGAPGSWPDYQLCEKSKTFNDVIDRSRADAQFVYFSLRRHRSPQEIAKKLAEVSPRAKESGEKYINRTIAAGLEYLGLGVAQ